MIIRDAKLEDWSQIDKLYKEFCREFNGLFEETPKIGEHWFIVCEDGDRIIGYGTACYLNHANKQYTQGEQIYVVPEYRGTKAAGLMYRSFMKWARSEGNPILLMCEPKELEMWQRKGYKAIRHITVKEIK